MNEISTRQHDWFLIEVGNDRLVYTNATSVKMYNDRVNSTHNIYTMTLYFTGIFKKCADKAVIEVHSSSRAVEQEIKIIHFLEDYGVLNDLVCNLNHMDLPLF